MTDMSKYKIICSKNNRSSIERESEKDEWQT